MLVQSVSTKTKNIKCVYFVWHIWHLRKHSYDKRWSGKIAKLVADQYQPGDEGRREEWMSDHFSVWLLEKGSLTLSIRDTEELREGWNVEGTMPTQNLDHRYSITRRASGLAVCIDVDCHVHRHTPHRMTINIYLDHGPSGLGYDQSSNSISMRGSLNPFLCMWWQEEGSNSRPGYSSSRDTTTALQLV